MDHATCFRLLPATHFATSLLPLTVRLIPVLTEIGRLIVGFRRAELTPQVCHQFETQLHAQLRELFIEAGRVRYWQHGQAKNSPDLAISDLSRFLGIVPLPRIVASSDCPASSDVSLSRFLGCVPVPLPRMCPCPASSDVSLSRFLGLRFLGLQEPKTLMGEQVVDLELGPFDLDCMHGNEGF